ncbi:MAG: PIN domain-containing protein [Candidatus Omnitrophota bacterium]
MENMAIVDAGPLIALFDKSDKYHVEVKEALGKYRSQSRGKIITTWPVVSEAVYILADRVHLQAGLDFFAWIGNDGLEIFDFGKDHLPRVINLQKKYSNVPMDFADATLVIVAQDLKADKVFTIDKDFLIYRILGKKHFKNLM